MIAPTPPMTGRQPRPIDGEGKVSLTLRVNGRDYSVHVRPHHTLLDVLRSEVGLTGTREGCGVGMCGACTVLMDGRPISGCLLLAVLAEGRDIVTIEGLEGPNGELHPIQQAYVDHTGFQCSYCTPGFILATKALLDEQPAPSRDEAKAFLAGNLCRCGSYVKIMDSVMDAADRMRTV
jgi:carbon-monoxide dehydrogenase small subunit/isoquinoline 1-oxidoreductase alpha subunit/xanthine dehydrogenase YagT iron-sulfur-binding subunit